MFHVSHFKTNWWGVERFSYSKPKTVWNENKSILAETITMCCLFCAGTMLKSGLVNWRWRYWEMYSGNVQTIVASWLYGDLFTRIFTHIEKLLSHIEKLPGILFFHADFFRMVDKATWRLIFIFYFNAYKIISYFFIL